MGAGLCLGVLASAADALIEPGPAYAYTRALSMVLNALSTWAVLGILAGWLVRRPLPAMAAGPVSLVAAVGAYYLFGVTLGDRIGLGAGQVLDATRHWLVMAVLVGPLFGLVGVLVRRRGLVGVLACAVIPLGVAYDMVVRHHLSAASFRLDPVASVAQVAMVAVAVLLGWLAARRARSPVFAHSEVAIVPEHVGWEQG